MTGGLTGLGLATAGWLVERGARHLVLAGRRAAGDEAQTAIEAWANAGVEVACVQADIGDPAGADRLFATVNAMPVPLRGVIHSAGTIDDATLLQQDWPRIQRVLKAKADGGWNLHSRTRSAELDFFVLFSSGASLLGSMGQANYAAANGFLDGMSFYRRSRRLPALAIDWGAWGETGLAAHHEVLERSRRLGVNPIDTRNGLRALECLLASGAGRAAVLPVDWKRFSAAGGYAGGAGLLAGLEAGRDIPPINPEVAARHWRAKLQAADPIRRHALLQELVGREAAGILGLKGAQTVDPRQPLQEMGLDSLMAVQLRNTLAAWAGVELPASLLYNYPSVEQLVDHLAGCMAPGQSAASAVTESKGAPTRDLDAMTEDELARILQQEIELA